MSTKKCSRCEKTVYPTEELKCLDKVWHKICFKCQECGMTLNMKTYKGFNKLPYCNAHCPQAKHTSIADTPEIRRLAENTRIQSNVKYHEDFEKQKGKVTAVADDPETLRIRNTTKIISNVSYHGELDKKKEMEQRRQLASTGGPPGEKNGEAPPAQDPPRLAAPHHQPPKDSPYSSKLSSTVIFTSQDGAVDNPPSRRIGSIADYDPINDNYGSVATGPRTAAPPPATTYYHAPPPVSDVPPAVPQIQPNYNKPAAPPGLSFCAMYDYTAQDMDEVSFREGDVIINCKPIDEGWMVGTVQRTGQSGMLPANYVEPIN